MSMHLFVFYVTVRQSCTRYLQVESSINARLKQLYAVHCALKQISGSADMFVMFTGSVQKPLRLSYNNLITIDAEGQLSLNHGGHVQYPVALQLLFI